MIWKGINSRTVGITVTELPEIILPEERVTFTDVPGLSGSLAQIEGVDVYKDITLLVSTQIIELQSIENGIVLDSELQEAYWDSVLKNSCMTGEFPVLGESNTAISWTGGTVAQVTIIPRWVSL